MVSIDGTDISGATIDGTDVSEITIDGEVAWTAIPDSDIYLHDDWNDGKLTNRDNSATTTTNGQEGVYRPEWTEFVSGVSVVDKYGDTDDYQVQITQTSGIETDYSLPDDSIKWVFEFRKDNNDSDNGLGVALTSDGSNHIVFQHDENNSRTLIEGAGPLIEGSNINYGSVNTIEITRDASTSPATWEFILNGNSQGTDQNDTFPTGWIAIENNTDGGKYAGKGSNAPDSDSWWDDLKISPL